MNYSSEWEGYFCMQLWNHLGFVNINCYMTQYSCCFFVLLLHLSVPIDCCSVLSYDFSYAWYCHSCMLVSMHMHDVGSSACACWHACVCADVCVFLSAHIIVSETVACIVAACLLHATSKKACQNTLRSWPY